MLSIDWRGLALPFAYLVILSGALMTFSSIYRKRRAAQSANLEPWFGPHLQRNVYLSLLHLAPEDGAEKAPKVPDSVLRAALLRRAVEDMRRLLQLRLAKQAIQPLLQRGSVGDDLWQRFERGEKELLEVELRDVVMEANALSPNWGQSIFQSANEMASNTTLRKRIEDIQKNMEAEKDWWEKRRAAIQSDFMKELDNGGSKTTEDDAVVVESAGTPGGKKKKGKK